MRHWISRLALASLLGAASVESKHKVEDFDWETITPARKLEYHSCYDEYKCARLIVPLDWLDESNPYTVALAIIKLPAKVPDNDPAFGGTIFTNPGGPGGSGVMQLLSEAHIFQETADTDSRKYEIFSWDPRGVQLTSPAADCYADQLARDTDTIQRAAIGPTISSPDALRRHWARVHGYGKICAQSAVNGSTIPYATTASVVRDMVHMLDKIQELRDEEAADRVVVDQGAQQPLQRRGEKDALRLQYWGLSYGTFLGNTFASMFPGRVGRIIVDGVVDADDYVAGGWRTNLQDTEELVAAFYKTCFTSGSKCALNRPSDKKWEDVRSRVLDLIAHLDNDPFFEVDGKSTHILTGYDVVNAFTRPMYDPYESFVPLAKKLNEAVEGNYTALLNTVKTQFPRLDETCLTPNTSTPSTVRGGEAAQSVVCGDAEDARNLTLADYQEYVSELVEQSPTFAGYWSQIRFACTAWDVRPKFRFTGPFTTPEHDPAVVEGKPAAPLLFLTSRLDPVTPVRNAYRMSERHPGSTVVIQESLGHCSISAGSKCMKEVIQKYMEHGIVPKDGTTCEADCDPWDGETCLPSTKGISVAGLSPQDMLF
ncbi:Tripeptidyl aminopeptidase 2 [Colletotrichum truncatum]|uniref:Tripeptidyl aminopeptidase 2 n=1 Tax=Colletotrichum truncatum TaxID=5467 RepID=A0ACC3Z313_COLTU|nr:Tripeptidyl aminopeptidase 2 [Colletotrichum truncatum]KAF6793213.1 Tripeptidyl aminopeptidase 2 [Colletotrichum truncatum]